MQKNKLLIILVLTFVIFQLSPATSRNLTSNVQSARLIHAFLNQSSMNIGSFPNFQGSSVSVRKPAIYLYPETPTIVNIKLANSILIDTNIPRYAKNKGWKVLANPDGTLNDYQVEYTNCKDFIGNEFGFEYAKKACLNNTYPYIYWDGMQIAKPLPTSKRGWLIKKEDIQDFLSEKLEELKFNQKERYDFLKYWVTILTNNQAKSYFIYFIQNEAVDRYLPMKVSPKLDSSNRLYMIAKEIKSDISLNIKPQKLESIRRKGFTLVEWGGVLIKQ